MKKLLQTLLLLAIICVPMALFAQMQMHKKMPMGKSMMGQTKGMEATYVGVISGNECALSSMMCQPSHVKYETPVFVPDENGKPDFHRVYYMAGVPVSVQDEVFLQEVKVTGTFYPSTSTVSVKTISVKDGKNWKPFVIWHDGMTGMACCPTGMCCRGKGQACCHLHPEKKM